ncbi:MAG: helix-turn-helix domain-containing protein, partial [Nakamurella sp.]
ILVMLLPGSDAGIVAREVSTALSRTLGGPVTAAGQAVGLIKEHSSDWRHLPQAYAAARDCLTAMLALGRDGQRATMADLGFVGVVLSGGDSPGAFVTGALGPVLDYDAARGTDLIDTVDAYFGSGCHLGHTATLLHVHPDALGQRLSRIGKLLGDDWVEPQRALEIQLALRLRTLLGPVPA